MTRLWMVSGQRLEIGASPLDFVNATVQKPRKLVQALSDELQCEGKRREKERGV